MKDEAMTLMRNDTWELVPQLNDVVPGSSSAGEGHECVYESVGIRVFHVAKKGKEKAEKCPTSSLQIGLQVEEKGIWVK